MKKYFTKKNDYLQLRSEFYTHYMNKYYNLFMNRHIANGLDYQERDFLFRQLWANGSVWIFKYGVEGASTPVLTPYAPQNWNIYDYPVSVIPINLRGVKFIPSTPQVVDKDGVIIYAQRNKKGVKEVVDFYSKKLAFVEIVIQMNLLANKTPYVIGTSGEDEKKAEALWDEIVSDDAKLFWSFEAIEKVKSLISGAPFIIDKLYNYKQVVENELREILGLDNLGVNEKKEHLITDEIEQNQEVVNASADCFLDVLREGFDRANKVLGLNLSIELNVPKYEEDEETNEEEEIQNEE